MLLQSKRTKISEESRMDLKHAHPSRLELQAEAMTGPINVGDGSKDSSPVPAATTPAQLRKCSRYVGVTKYVETEVRGQHLPGTNAPKRHRYRICILCRKIACKGVRATVTGTLCSSGVNFHHACSQARTAAAFVAGTRSATGQHSYR